MSRKIKILFIFVSLFSLGVAYFSIWGGVTLLLICLLSYFLLLLAKKMFIKINCELKNTNWWQNQFLYTHQFVSNAEYRNNTIRNYDLVNLGSNPAVFAFFYENVKGQNWATGSQGQDMDFEILKYYHSYIKEGGFVIIPIMPFTAISSFLKARKEYWGVAYYAKFVKILDWVQYSKIPYMEEIAKYMKYPLLINKKAWKYLFFDESKDNRIQISEQPMMHMELMQDAKKWENGWKKEFCVKSFNEVLDERWAKYYQDAVVLNHKIVDFCLERNYTPVFLCPPMTKYLADIFPVKFWKYAVTDFVKEINIHDVKFLDYSHDARFQDASLYINSFFMNLKGRKIFTKQVLKDLSIC